MKRSVLDVIAHEDLTEGELCELRRFFDSEYFDEYGEWDPEQPYGYSLHDVHVIARRRPRGRECGMGPP
jgi:aminoglycoside 2'-N-acetyltransferase I